MFIAKAYSLTVFIQHYLTMGHNSLLQIPLPRVLHRILGSGMGRWSSMVLLYDRSCPIPNLLPAAPQIRQCDLPYRSLVS